MSEFIGSRISLVSKSDIRYVGTLHEINSENSTVALEQVSSFGTEGRRNKPDEEIPGSNSVYEYIVFRGSDVKDLRIEEPPKESKPPPPPQVPDDPAILGSGARPQTSSIPPQPAQQQPPGPRNQPGFQPPPQFPYQQYNQFPPPQQFPPGTNGFQGPPRGFPGFPGMPYGGPPGYYPPPPPPPPGHGFPDPPGPGPFSPQNNQMPFGGPGPQQQAHRQQPPQSAQQPIQPPVTGSIAPKETMTILQRPNAENQPPIGPKAETQKSQSITPAPTISSGPRPPVESKPSPAAATAPAQKAPKVSAIGPKDVKIVPAVPRVSPALKNAPTATNANLASTTTNATAPPQHVPKQPQAAANAAQYQNATTQAATAAVAAAMARLAPTSEQKPRPTATSVVDNLTQKVNEMRVDSSNRTPNGPRGRGRGGRGRGRGIEVPHSDFDFELANAKFNKQDLVKEAIATGEPLEGEGINGLAESPAPNGTADVQIPAAAPYNSKSSFFDNISSEARDRHEAADGSRRAGGPEQRGEERRKNLETFGMGSVDGGYRGGFRGRGRGRGYRGYGARGGGYVRGNGGYNGRGAAATT